MQIALGSPVRWRAGDDIEVAIQTKRIHCFDPETSLAIRD